MKLLHLKCPSICFSALSAAHVQWTSIDFYWTTHLDVLNTMRVDNIYKLSLTQSISLLRVRNRMSHVNCLILCSWYILKVIEIYWLVCLRGWISARILVGYEFESHPFASLWHFFFISWSNLRESRILVWFQCCSLESIWIIRTLEQFLPFERWQSICHRSTRMTVTIVESIQWIKLKIFNPSFYTWILQWMCLLTPNWFGKFPCDFVGSCHANCNDLAVLNWQSAIRVVFPVICWCFDYSAILRNQFRNHPIARRSHRTLVVWQPLVLLALTSAQCYALDLVFWDASVWRRRIVIKRNSLCTSSAYAIGPSNSAKTFSKISITIVWIEYLILEMIELDSKYSRYWWMVLTYDDDARFS